MRAFFAIPLSVTANETVARLQAHLKQNHREGLRWIPPEDFHITLKFLGESDPAALENMGRELKNWAQTWKPPLITLAGVDCFPTRGAPRGVWLAWNDSDGSLAQVQSELEQIAETHGFPVEERPFSPHLTIARVRRGVKLAELRTACQALAPPIVESQLSEIILFESTLTSEGAEYSALERFNLGGPLPDR